MNISGDSIREVHPLFPVEGGGSIPTSPLQLFVGLVELDVAIKLNELWHSRLPRFATVIGGGRSLSFAAEYKGLYYASAIWTPPIARRLNGTGRYELRRLAIAPDAPKNTASRMLRVMRLMLRKFLPDIKILISYQDTEAHTGAIYKASGWQVVSENKVPKDGWLTRDRPPTQTNSNKARWEIAL